MSHIWVHHPSEAVDVEHPRCWRCGALLWVDLDPTEGICPNHGTVPIRKPKVEDMLPWVNERDKGEKLMGVLR